MRTYAGRDWQCGVMADTTSDGSGAFASANWMALSSDAAAPDVNNTSLTSELSGGTMDRAQASFAHTTGTASYTLIHTFTSDRVVSVYKYGVFTASSGGVLAFEQDFDEAVPMKIGDAMQVVDTITL